MSPPSVEVGPLHLHDQWVELYALLALQQREDAAALVLVDRVHRLSGWKLKQPGSVGKEIARHLADLRKNGLEHVIVSPSKTKAWRLGVALADVQLVPSPQAVSTWLADRAPRETTHDVWGQELLRLVEVAVLLRKGRASEAEDALGAAPRDLHDTALLAFRALLEGRAAYMGDDEGQLGKLDALIEEWARRPGAAERAVEARLRSFRVMHDRFGDAARTRSTLTKLVAALELTGDAASLGVMLNVLGVLERRSGNPARAFEHLSRAAGLLAISGDYQTLQAALYNAALAHRSVLKQQEKPPDVLAFSLLDLCLMICHEFHVGDDSALAELTRADWLLDRGSTGEAASLLDRASHILQATEASYDQAYFLQVRARLLFERGEPMRDVVRDMKAAIRIYGDVGDLRAGKRATTMLRHLVRSRPS